MWFITFIFKNITRRLLRSLLTIVAVAIAIGSVVALVGIADGFEHTFLGLYANAGVDMIVVRGSGARQMNSALDQDLGDRMKKVPGVKEVLAGLVDMVSFPEYGLYAVVLQGWEPETAVFNQITITKGRSLVRSDKRAILLGIRLAENMEKKVGDSVDVVEGEKYKVVGIYESHNVYMDGAVVMPLEELQTLMDRPRKITGFSIILDEPKDAEMVQRVKNDIEALAPALAARTTADHVKAITEIRLAKGMAWLTSVIALIIGLFGMMNTMLMSVHERTREIGILRAVGWRVSRVVRMIVMEAAVLSFLGAVCGIVGAIALVKLLTRIPAASGQIEGHIEPVIVVYALVAAVLLGLVGSILPAVRAARLMPTEALRYE
jgi:putative ABC transport system permease protein